jgi:hypothetical protein
LPEKITYINNKKNLDLFTFIRISDCWSIISNLKKVVELAQGSAIVVPRIGQLSTKVLQQTGQNLKNIVFLLKVKSRFLQQLEHENGWLGHSVLAICDLEHI